ncbi:hypothetical protein GQR60_07510 [Labilibaculum sp. A4]|uniref:FeoB-associated Cys-rich membrane protein n=1 Tax=Labilibaculum euxinus TaxID=2686357 RepID=A0A7M4D0P5_9BACT|nr:MULTISPECIES: hypothetical protein [Labilibaculum]MBN2598327.1 hypothetical protein [Marinifilaceae bacterium]MDQ1769623.1 hypothetical protein [Labilibaculum euxinus]MUP36224.1 hypothetical protein [Labilibaculum euxinus]MVB05429.1 hypothetical protein [Labilibaculum euxinus]MWN76180.1 hypothetical protein [Labilibaculum euxinus]
MAVFFKILLLSLFLLLLAFIGIGIKLLFDKNAKFTGGSCGSCNCTDPDKENCDTQ